MKRIIATGIPDFESLRMNQRFHLMNRKQGISWIAVALVALLLFLLPVSALMEEENQNNTGTIPGVGLSNNPDGLSSPPDGTTVQLQWIEKPESTLQSLKESGKISSETLNSFYDDLDDGQKLWLFQLNAYDPSGKKLEQEDFQSTMEVYLELGDDWEIDNINAIYLENDEILEKPEIVYKDVNGVMKRFAVIRLKHFSTYAVILRGTFGNDLQ